MVHIYPHFSTPVCAQCLSMSILNHLCSQTKPQLTCSCSVRVTQSELPVSPNVRQQLTLRPKLRENQSIECALQREGEEGRRCKRRGAKGRKLMKCARHFIYQSRMASPASHCTVVVDLDVLTLSLQSREEREKQRKNDARCERTAACMVTRRTPLGRAERGRKREASGSPARSRGGERRAEQHADTAPSSFSFARLLPLPRC